MKSINTHQHAELRDKILSYSCGKKSPMLEFYDTVQAVKHFKRRRRMTVVKQPLMLKPFFRENHRLSDENSLISDGTELCYHHKASRFSSQAFEYQNVDNEKLQNLSLQVHMKRRRMTMNLGVYREAIKKLKPVNIDHIINVLESDPNLKIEQLDNNVDSTQYLTQMEQSFEVRQKQSTLPTLRTRASSLGDMQQPQPIRFPSLPQSIERTSTKRQVSISPSIEQYRIKHKEYEKPFKLTSRKEKSQQHLIDSMQLLITTEELESIRKSHPDKMPLIKYIHLRQMELLTHVVHKHHSELVNILFKSLEICQQINSLKLFANLTFYLARFTLDCELPHQATFLFKQCVVISEFSQLYKLKCMALIYLSECSRKLHLYPQAIELIKKALVYSWVGDFVELEIQCYDMLGLCYFYLGDLRNSEIFHVKWSLAEVEPRNGYFRKTSKAFVMFYERYLPFITKTLNKQMMFLVSLPILNVFETDESGKPANTKCDQYRMVRYDNCDGQKLINEFLTTREFTQFNLDYYQKEGKPHQIELEHRPTRIVKREPMPRRITSILEKYTLKDKKFNHAHDIYENPLYNPSLDKRVAHRFSIHKNQTCRLVQDISDTGYEDRINQEVGVSRRPYGEKQAQIYVRHIQSTLQKPEQHEMFYKRHYTLLKTMITDFIDDRL